MDALRSIWDSVWNAVSAIFEVIYDLGAGIIRMIVWPFKHFGAFFRGTSELGWRWYWFSRTMRNLFWVAVLLGLVIWGLITYFNRQAPPRVGYVGRGEISEKKGFNRCKSINWSKIVPGSYTLARIQTISILEASNG